MKNLKLAVSKTNNEIEKSLIYHIFLRSLIWVESSSNFRSFVNHITMKCVNLDQIAKISASSHRSSNQSVG